MKLIALDLDGTTVNSNKEISKENIQAIIKAQQEGHVVMVLSGRAVHFIAAELDKYGLNCPIGANNGSSLYVNGELINKITINKEKSREVVIILDNELVPFNVATNKGVYASKDWENRLNNKVLSGSVPKEIMEYRNFKLFTQPPHVYGHSIYNETDEIINDDTIEIQKFFVITLDPSQKERMVTSLNSIEGIGIVPGTIHVDIMHTDATKGYGLKLMAEYFGIPLEDTIAIGDDANDISMFEISGLSIAMGNADDFIKEKCDLVTHTNDEHGVAYAINNYVLNS
ncbi:Cof-type HAD-IIB family hydrolase [Sutcliffiella cohnii]